MGWLAIFFIIGEKTLLRISIRKNGIYSAEGTDPKFICGFISKVVIDYKKFMFFAIILAILFPCNVKATSLYGVEMFPELKNRLSMSRESFCKEFCEIKVFTFDQTIPFVDKHLFFKEGSPETGGTFHAFLFFDQPPGEKVGYSGTTNSPNNDKASCDKRYVIGSRSHFYSMAFLGGFIGLVISALLISAFFALKLRYYT